MSSQTPPQLSVPSHAATEVVASVQSQSDLSLLDDPMEWGSFGKPHGSASFGTSGFTDPAHVPVWDSQVALEGMYCSTCALTIEDALRAVPGVEQVEVSAASRRARVVWHSGQVKPSQWIQAVRRAGYQAVPAQDARARELRQQQNRKALWRWLLATFCMMQVMMYAWPSYEAKAGDLSQEMEALLRWASWVICIPMLIFACGPFFSGALRDLRYRRVSMDLPVALGMLITFVISSIGTFDPQGMFGREVFYDSLVMFVAFLLTGRWLEIRLRDRTAGALDAVLNRLPDSVEQLQSDGSFLRVALRRIACGDVVRVLPGEAFPADGCILRGRTQADEALLTGESRPITKEQGNHVIAGSYNLNAAVEMRVDAVAEQTRFAQVVHLMESAATQKPRLAQLADKVAGPFLIAVLLLAAAAAVYWWPHDPGHAMMVAATVLIVTCPCALSLATPVAMLTAAGTLARQGVLVRNLQGLEALAHMDTLVFDKTGTLTQDGMLVDAQYLHPQANDTDRQRWQDIAIAIAMQSMHPVSRAVVALGQSQMDTVIQVLELQELGGQGLRALVLEEENMSKGQGPVWMRLGSYRFAGGGGWSLPSDHAVFLAREQPGSDDVQPLMAFVLHEGLRPEAGAVVQTLADMGITIHLLSGDNRQTVASVAQSVGIVQAQAECSPDGKLAAVQSLQAQGNQVGMVGDGLNDGPVLAGANVSFAFGRAVPLARARSDFVVLGNDLMLVSRTVVFARKTLRIVRQNLWWAAGYNAVSVPFAVLGMMPAWLAGLGMALSSLLVVMNAARLARFSENAPATGQ